VNKTLLVDGDAVLKLGFFGLKNFQDNQNNLGAVFYFLNTLRKSIDQEGYTKIVVTWDGKNNCSTRRKIYPEYKSNRREKRLTEEKEESLRIQKTKVQQYLEEIFIRQCEFENYEADDCIAFYCLSNEKEEITILSNDRDLTQLVSDNVNLKFLNNSQIIKKGDKIKFEKHMVPVENIKVIKIICGDSSDNISGIKGVGIKTVINTVPEILEKNINLEYFLYMCRDKFLKGESNFRVNNIVKGLTKEGELGRDFFKRNKELVDLTKSILPKDSKDNIKELIKENMDPDGRSYKNLLRMMMNDGLFDFIGNSDESFINFTKPFLTLVRVEKNKFKKVLENGKI
jgi:5'-3' exonuclease